MPYKFTDIYETPDQQHADDLAGDVSWGDYATALAAGSTDVVGSIPAVTRWIGESMPEDSLFGQMLANRGRYHERKLNETAEDLTSSMSDSAQARSLATIGSSDFLAHPFSSLALKTTRTAPSIAASIGATLFTAGGAPSMAAIAAISGGLSAGETLNEMYTAVDNMKDQDLRKSSTIYDGYRKRGLSEDQARRELDRAMIGYKPFGLFALGAVTGVVGPAGQIAGALGKAGLTKAATEVAKRGVLKRVGAEALQGGASEFVQTGAEQLSQEKAAVDVGLQPDIRWGTVASAAAEGGLIGGILGGPTGIKSHTNANPRPEEDNPPAVEVENAVKPNQASVPARGSNTTASPPVVPARGAGYTGPTSRAATIPGATPNQKKPKVAPNAATTTTAGTPAAATAPVTATPATGAVAGLTPNTYAQVAPKGTQGDPGGLVAGPTEVAALNVQVAPTAAPVAPAPVFNNLPPDRGLSPSSMVPAARAPAQAVPTEVTPAGNIAPPVPPATAAAPAPAPAPQVPARTAPGGGLGAGTPAVVQGRPSAFGGVEQPVAGPRVLPVAPTKANAVEIARQNAAREAAAAADAKAETDAAAVATEEEAKKNVHYSMVGVEKPKGKDNKLIAKRNSDHVIAQTLLDERPTNPAVPTTEEGINALKSELSAVVESAVKQGADLRGQVGHVTTPHSLVWLREAQELVSYLNGKKPKLPDKQKAVARFIDRETRIRLGEGVAVKAERALEAEQAQAARGKGKGQVTEQTQESDAAAASTAKKPISVEGPTETKKLARKAEKGGGTITVEVPKAVEAKPEEDLEDLVQKSEVIIEQTKAQKKIADIKAKEEAKQAEARKRGEAKRAEIEARVAEENKKIVEAKKAEAAKPKLEPAQEIEAIKEQAAEKKAAQEEKPPPKARKLKKTTTIVAPKASAPAASSAEFVAKVKEEVEPNPSDAQILADNASKAHVNIEGMPLAIETAANTERQIITPTGSRIGRLYKFAYGHILGTKSPDGQPIDIFLGPEAYPDNPKLDGLRVVVIDQVDPDTKVPDEPKVMYGFETVKDAVAAYEDSYPRGSERRGDVTPMTPNEFKQWRISKQETKNAQEPAGAPVSELEALIAEQTEDAAVDAEIDDTGRAARRDGKLAPPGHAEGVMSRRVERNKARAIEHEKIAAAFAVDSGRVSRFLHEGKLAIKNSFLDKISQAIFPRFASRIRELAGDVQVYVVPDDVYSSQLGRRAHEAGFYSMVGDYILIRESQTANDVDFAALILHEATHAAFVKAVYSNPKYIPQLENILNEAVAANVYDVRHYGLSNIDELIAEAFSNEGFQTFLLNTKASDELVKELGLDGKRKSLWDVLVRWMGRVMGLGKVHDTLFAAVMKMSVKLELEVDNLQGPASDIASRNFIEQLDKENARAQLGVMTGRAFNIREAINEKLPARVKKALGTDIAQQEQAGSPWLMTLRSLDQLIQAAKKYGLQFYEHLRKVGDTIERIRTTAERYLDEMTPLINESHGLEQKYKGTDLWKRFVALVHAETRLQVYSDRDLSSQKHLGKNTLRGAQPKAEWRELNNEFKALEAAAPDLIAFRTKAMDFYKESQNKERLGIIKNVLKITGFDDPAMAQRLFDGDETEDDIALLKQTYDHIKGASELAKLKGPYFPQMRRGNYVVRALFKIVAPKYALRALPDEDGTVRTWEFAGKNARNQAMDFAEAQKGTGMVATPVSVWVDKNTGERYFNLGKPDEVRVRPEDADAEQRFRVTVQNRFVEFYETKRQARRVAAALASDPAVDTSTIAPVVEKRFNPGDRQAGLMSHQLSVLADSLARRPGYQNLSANEKNQVVQAFNTASLRLLSSTRIQTKRMQRTNVLGASDDFTRNLTEYSQSVSSYLAMLDHQNDLNTAMVAARKEADSFSDYNKSGGQSSIMNVIEKRVKDATAFDGSGRAYEWGNRLLALSFASKLISPATNLLNSLQVAMVSYPALAARFGAGRAAQMLFKTYKEIGVANVLKQGLVASKRALVQGPNAEMPTMVEDIISRVSSPQVRAMLRHLIEVGSIDANAGIEISDLIETRTGALGTLDHYTNYIHTFGRQMPKAIEAINRTVTAIASYNLEMQRSGDHDKAVRFAQETTNMTQGLYSHTNAAPIFNHPLGRLSLQFKKYGQLMYGMLGHNIGKAIMNAEPGDRAEALKTLGYLLGTHFVMAGALGLPQEPLKWLIIGARAAGADVSWAGFEHAEREFLSSILGQKLGEIAARGITRALPESFSFDLSGRAGMQDLLTYGEPRSADKQDLSAFFWDTVAGAPAQMLGDWMKGSQAALRGDIGEAAQRFSVVKVVTDAIKSYRNTSGDQKTAAGYEKLSAYGLGETAIRAFGFTPSREAETSEARNYFYSATKAVDAARDDLMRQWADVSPSDRGRLWGTVERFNYGKVKDERLTRADLDKYAKRRRTEERSGLVKSGFRVTRRDTETYRKLGNTYNISP